MPPARPGPISELRAAADAVCQIEGPKVLRFTACGLAGQRCYTFATNIGAITEFLRQCWNHRHELAALIRANER